MTILEAFVTDRLSLQSKTCLGNAEYLKRDRLANNAEEQLMARLSPEDQRLLEELNSLQADRDDIYTRNSFIDGYRLGVLMTVEVFSERDRLMTQWD